MNIILLTEKDRTGGDSFTVADHRAEHIRTVLQAKQDDGLEVGLLNGPLGKAIVTTIDQDSVTFAVSEWRELPPSVYEVDIICAVPRPKTVKKLLAIAASMNVRSLHFVRANRTDKSYLESPLLQEPERLPYLFDGLSQGKFTRLPLIDLHPLFRPFIEDRVPELFGHHRKLVADPSGPQISSVIPLSLPVPELVVAIGPEGGWVPFELELLQRVGFTPFQLGPWTLRVENALVAALSQLALVATKGTD